MKEVACFTKLILTILILIIFSNISCSKKEPNAILLSPYISWISPGSGHRGDTVTISGQNFTGTIHVDFGNTPSNYEVINGTTIKAVMPRFDTAIVDITVQTNAGKVIKKGFRCLGQSPEIIDGYKNSDEVGKESLVAYWGFNSDTLGPVNTLNALEYFSNSPPVKLVNAARAIDGVKGNSLSLQDGYLIYPSLSNLSGPDLLSSYTISLWVLPDYTFTYVPLFLLTGAQYPDLEGQIQLSVLSKPSENLVTPDSMFINWVQAINTASGIISDRWNANPQNTYLYYSSGTNWTFLTVTYDGLSRELVSYINGVRIGSKKSSVITDPAKFRLEAQTQVMFGTFAFTEDGFSNSFRFSDHPGQAHGVRSQLDEIRVFKAALSQPQINSLYFLGMAGR